MCIGYCGFQEGFHTRAIRDDKKATQSEGPMTVPEISLMGMRRKEEVVHTRGTWEGVLEKGASESGLEK